MYCDNFYNSIPLAEKLLEHTTAVCDTVCKNQKGIPTEILTKKLKKGEVTGRVNDKDVKIIKWKDKRDVLTISTVNSHDVQMIPTGKKNRKGEVILKPKSVLDYNEAKKKELTCRI